MEPRIVDLDLDDDNIAEMAGHRVSDDEAFQVLENAPAFLPNRRGHRAPVIMVGPTFGGRFLTIPIEPVNAEAGIWRPATAWDSSPNERVRYYRAR